MPAMKEASENAETPKGAKVGSKPRLSVAELGANIAFFSRNQGV
jgi:hypothetical protein